MLNIPGYRIVETEKTKGSLVKVIEWFCNFKNNEFDNSIKLKKLVIGKI